jgi:hypothetical protein
MPVLTVFSLKPNAWQSLILLVKESKFCADAKIWDTEEADFFKDVLPSQLNDQSIAAHEILQRERWYLHDVADIKAVDPFALVKVPKNVLHISFTNI